MLPPLGFAVRVVDASSESLQLPSSALSALIPFPRLSNVGLGVELFDDDDGRRIELTVGV